MAFYVRRHLTRRSIYGSRIFNLRTIKDRARRVLVSTVRAGIIGKVAVPVFASMFARKYDRYKTGDLRKQQYLKMWLNNPKLPVPFLLTVNRYLFALDKGIMLFPIYVMNTHGVYSTGKETIARNYLPMEHVMFRDNRMQELFDDIQAFDSLSYEDFVKRNLKKALDKSGEIVLL